MNTQFRRSLTEQNKANAAMSSSKQEELDGNGGYESGIRKTMLGSDIENEPLRDPLIYPGVYAPSGIDMMGILVGFGFRWLWFLSLFINVSLSASKKRQNKKTKKPKKKKTPISVVLHRCFTASFFLA